MVGLAGLEPATFRPPDGRATRLRYSPTSYARPSNRFSAEGKGQSALHVLFGAVSDRLDKLFKPRERRGKTARVTRGIDAQRVGDPCKTRRFLRGACSI